MPEEGVPLTPNDRLLTTNELISLASLFVHQGVTKIRLTGGEPTVRKDLVDIVQQLSTLSSHGLQTISMTTNGIALQRKLEPLVQAGLSQLNISLDTLDPHKFVLMTRRNGMEKVLATIDQALALPLDSLKINCVVMRGVNDDEVPQFVEMTRDKPLDIRFIEYMPFGGNKWKHNKLVPYTELLERIAQHYKIDQLERCTDAPNDTSKAYRVPGHVGKIGFISSMTDHFCSTCNRLRLTADGNLKVCLFGNTEVNLRDMLRSNATKEEVVKVISTAVKRKKKQHAGMFELANSTNRPMILIGG